MIGLNVVLLVGEVADIKVMTGGKVMAMKVKVTESYVDREGEVKQKSGTHKVTAFGEKNVSYLAGALQVGSMVVVKGTLENRSFENRDGVKQWETGVSAREVTPLDVAKAHVESRPDEMPF